MRVQSDAALGILRMDTNGIDFDSYYKECHAAMSLCAGSWGLEMKPIEKSADEGAMVFGGDYQ
jgi:hypothetical protein